MQAFEIVQNPTGYGFYMIGRTDDLVYPGIGVGRDELIKITVDHYTKPPPGLDELHPRIALFTRCKTGELFALLRTDSGPRGIFQNEAGWDTVHASRTGSLR